MLDSDTLFQGLLTAVPTTASKTVVADLAFDSLDDIPLVIHASTFAQDRNGPGLYSVTLSVTLYVDHSQPGMTEFIGQIYDGIRAWDTNPNVVLVPGVGAVESIERELSAFARFPSVQMTNNVVTQYVGSWELVVREF